MADFNFDSELSLKEKIGQLFIIGFRGSDISSDSEILREIAEYNPGGVILFDKDMVNFRPVLNIESPAQVQELITALQNVAHIPLFISIDQEGGQVARLKPEYGFPETLSHADLGKRDEVEFTQEESSKIAETLSEMGINLNFAPVVDLGKNQESSIITKKERSFGEDPERVIRHAEAYIDGHRKKNIINCCKHFPGHGSASGDTHAGFVDVTESWSDDELKPYQHLISRNKCPMIMTAHIFNAKLDEKYPSTLSHNIIDGLLREKLKFDGVVISDDMQMKAISSFYGLKESLKLGLQAGIDLFCFGNNLLKEQVRMKDLVRSVEALVDEGAVSEERIDESTQRIINLKSDFSVSF